ncbi:MAG: metallophosphoesterase [Actinomycetota bacterium]
MIRLAASADVHFGTESAGTLRPQLTDLPERADVYVLCGDLTRSGDANEASILAEELAGIEIPIVAVLGNHDYHSGQEDVVRKVMEESGVTVLEGEATTITTAGGRVGIAGTKGFGGGFAGACATEFGEGEMKSFIGHTKMLSAKLEDAINSLNGDARVVLTHYAPVKATLVGEKLEIYPFLGSYLLGEAVDRAGADLVLHGHAHAGTEKGVTPGGIHVRNVALPVIKHVYNVYCFGGDALDSC